MWNHRRRKEQKTEKNQIILSQKWEIKQRTHLKWNYFVQNKWLSSTDKSWFNVGPHRANIKWNFGHKIESLSFLFSLIHWNIRTNEMEFNFNSFALNVSKLSWLEHLLMFSHTFFIPRATLA